MRTKAAVHVLTGHTNTVGTVACQSTDPQVISGSHDSTIRLWDLAKGATSATLTHHKKSVRSIALHPTEYTMVSGSPDNIKQWKFPDGQFIKNFSGHNSIINTVAVNRDNVLISGGELHSFFFCFYYGTTHVLCFFFYLFALRLSVFCLLFVCSFVPFSLFF